MNEQNNHNTSPPREPRVGFAAQLRITYESAGQFEDQFAGNISLGGIFVQTKNPKPVGTRIRIQVMLRDGRTLLEAEGVVAWTRLPDNGAVPKTVCGMGVRFTSLNEASRASIEKIVAANAPAADFQKMLLEQAAQSGTAPLAPAPAKKEEELVLGIDLGTTFTCCAYVENGKPRIIPSEKGYYLLPSVVAWYEKKKQIIVGHAAVDQILINPEHTVYGFKRLIGRTYHSPLVAKCKEYFTYALSEGPNGEILVQLGERRYNMTEISSLILKEIHEVAEGTLKRRIQKAVISVPAYYNDQQRAAVKQAGELAGLHVLKIINEPTAAALAYGFNRGYQQTALIFDLGGGTFDVSILRITGNVFETLATNGDNFLGGLDFDRAVMQHLVANFEKETGIDLTSSPICMQRVRNAAEKMKIDLSNQNQTSAHLPFIAEREGQPIDLRASIDRDILNRLTEHLINRALIIVDKTLGDCKIERSAIDCVLLVGGQTRMPLIATKVEQFFGKPPSKGVHPDEVVALGAALFGHSLNQMESVLLKDVVSIPIGIGLPGGNYKVIVPKNSSLPVEKKFMVSTTKDKQTTVTIDFYQGESEKLVENEFLGSFEFSDLPPRPRGDVRLTLHFQLNEEALLTVSATHEESNRTVSKRIVTRDTPTTLREAIAAEQRHPTAAPGQENRSLFDRLRSRKG